MDQLPELCRTFYAILMYGGKKKNKTSDSLRGFCLFPWVEHSLPQFWHSGTVTVEGLQALQALPLHTSRRGEGMCKTGTCALFRSCKPQVL